MTNYVEQLDQHLAELEADPTVPLNAKLFEEFALTTSRTLSQQDSINLMIKLSALVPKLQQDPTAAIALLETLLRPHAFSDILSVAPGIDFVAGLDIRAVPYNRLLLSILQKATSSAADAATVAGWPEVVAALVRLWLCTRDPGVATESGKVLLGLLRVDLEPSAGSQSNGLGGTGQGLVWKRVFQDHDVYGLFFSICSLKGDAAAAAGLSKSERTLAQARLLEWLPQVGAMDWHAITKSHHPSVEELHTQREGAGLLYFASVNMVDTADDILMHRCLIDFFSDLLKTIMLQDGAASSSVSLSFLVDNELHAKSVAYYLHPRNPDHDPLAGMFLEGPSANYVATYAASYPQHFLESAICAQTIARLSSSFDRSPSQWGHQESPKHDLHVLASLPRKALLPRGTAGSWKSSPLSLLPSRTISNADILNTLAVIFHGPERNETITYPKESPLTDRIDPSAQVEAQAARMLYFLYLNYNNKLFSDLVQHAETVALKEHALAAINVIASIITSEWANVQQSSDGEYQAATEDQFLSWLPHPPTATPSSGVLAILAPPSLEYTLPYLLKPAQTFSNLVGGRGDSESAAYKIASAKFDALRALHYRLQKYADREPGQGYEDILETLQRRIRQGPWSTEGEVGGKIATLDL